MRVASGSSGELAVKCAAPADELIELDTAARANGDWGGRRPGCTHGGCVQGDAEYVLLAIEVNGSHAVASVPGRFENELCVHAVVGVYACS